MKKSIWILLILAGMCLNALADDKGINLAAGVDNDKPGVGDTVSLTVRAGNARGFEISFPDRPEHTGDFSFVASHDAKHARIGYRTPGKVYVLGIYSAGTHVIPPIKVKYKRPGDKDWVVAETRQIPVEVASRLTGKDKDIKDIKALASFRSGAGAFVLVALSLLFIAALTAAVILWRNKRKKAIEEAARKKPAHIIAYEELSKLRGMDLPGHGRTKEYYVALSDIIRRYLENRFYYRAPEMTTEEFLAFIRKARELTDGHRDALKRFLTHCDMVKFARYGPTPLEVLDSFKLAEELVEKTVPEGPCGDEEGVGIDAVR